MLTACPPSSFSTNGVGCWGEPCGEPPISLHSHHVSLVQWTTRLLPVMRDPGSNPQGGTYVKLGFLLLALSGYNVWFEFMCELYWPGNGARLSTRGEIPTTFGLKMPQHVEVNGLVTPVDWKHGARIGGSSCLCFPHSCSPSRSPNDKTTRYIRFALSLSRQYSRYGMNKQWKSLTNEDFNTRFYCLKIFILTFLFLLLTSRNFIDL